MKTYTLKEVSKIINIAPGTLRQWERDFSDVLKIPRSKQGARIYSEIEIGQLQELKQLTSRTLSKDMIRQSMQNVLKPNHKEEFFPSSDISLDVMSHSVSTAIEENVLKNADQFLEAMENYKKNFLSEVKDEIRSAVKKEVLEEVKKEISKGTFITVKSLSDSIYKTSAKTTAEIEELSLTIEKSSAFTSDSLQYLSSCIANVSLETSEEIYTLSKQLSETSEGFSHYVNTTKDEISSLTDVIAKDHEFFKAERKEYRHHIAQRELAFQQLLTNFRDVAAAKEKKWWKFWS